MTEYDGQRDFADGLELAYRAIRDRVEAGGPGWRGFGPGSPLVGGNEKGHPEVPNSGETSQGPI